MSASGQSDEPVGRDFYFYVVFTKNAAGAVSPVSNKTSGTANYHLGDFSDGITPGAGDNLVGSADVSLLGAYYGISGAAITAAGVDYLDVGPTTDLRLTSRPFTDRLINFEDLIVVASNYGSVSSPQLAAHAAREAARAAGGPERVSVTAPSLADEGATFTATIELEAAGRLQGLSVELTWDAAIAVPLNLSSGGMLEAQGGLVLSPRRGVADAALLGLRDRGISGSGVLATVRFRALRSGDPAVRLGRVIGRDAENQPVDGGALATDDRLAAPARTLLFAPYPNPSSGESRLGFALARAAGVELAIYSVDGRRVRTLARGPLAAGSYRFTWSGDDDDHRPVAPGVYYARLTAGTARFTYELVQLR